MKRLMIGLAAAAAIALSAVGCGGAEPERIAPAEPPPAAVEQQQVAEVEQQEQPAPAVEQQQFAEPAPPPEVTLADLPLIGAGSTGSIYWSSEVDEFSKDVDIWIGVEGSSVDLFDGVLIIECNHDLLPALEDRATALDRGQRPFQVTIADIPHVEERRGTGRMQYVIDGGETQSISLRFFDAANGRRNARVGNSGKATWSREVTEFVESLYGASRLAVRFRVYDELFTTAFDLTGLFDTPIAPNIERCGEYGFDDA